MCNMLLICVIHTCKESCFSINSLSSKVEKNWSLWIRFAKYYSFHGRGKPASLKWFRIQGNTKQTFKNLARIILHRKAWHKSIFNVYAKTRFPFWWIVSSVICTYFFSTCWCYFKQWRVLVLNAMDPKSTMSVDLYFQHDKWIKGQIATNIVRSLLKLDCMFLLQSATKSSKIWIWKVVNPFH